MREVKGVIRPQRLDRVMEALYEIPNLPDVTASKVHAYSGSRSRDPEMPPESVETDFTKLEIVPPVEEFMRIRDVGVADLGAPEFGEGFRRPNVSGAEENPQENSTGFLRTRSKVSPPKSSDLRWDWTRIVALALRARPSPTPPRRTAWSGEGVDGGTFAAYALGA